MRSGISTHVFLQQRLTPSLLDALLESGVDQIEVFAARHHFDYTNHIAVQEIANWFRSNEVAASLHTPLFAPEDATSWSRHAAPSLNLIDVVKAKRIEAMDEVKRSLEAAEQVAFRSAVVHLGLGEDAWNTRALDDSLTAVEHLKAFAGPLGVQLLLENLNNRVATPANLVEIVRVGHFTGIAYCLDVGHAFLEEGTSATSPSPVRTGIEFAFEAFGEHLVELHLHDNNGVRDEHRWPKDGAIDFGMVNALVGAMKSKPVGVFEIAHELGHDIVEVTSHAKKLVKLAQAL